MVYYDFGINSVVYKMVRIEKEMNRNIRMRSVITENINNLLRTHQLGKKGM